MKVCITEKPSVAGDIASILGATERRDGYYEGNGYRVTWTYGHLCCLKEPHDYTPRWKPWSLGALPMIPDRFGIKLIDDQGIRRQFGVIRSLVGEADEVINCGDAGQEGELIQRWVMQLAGVKCPVKRLWISSLTDESIRQGFQDLRPADEYTNLYYAGMSRAIGDWILGMNATRLYTLKYSGNNGAVLSVGRVQTPTLALIVRRQREIDGFVPEEYFELKTVYRTATFNATKGRFRSGEEAQKALEAIRGTTFTVTDVTRKKGREAPPRLFDLTSLQVETNRRWGWSADDTLRLIQSLYEKKVTTYPRVDTTYLSEDIYPRIPTILRAMTPYAQWTAPVLAGKIPKSRKVFDNAKVTDHHAIIPTGQAPTALVGDERQLYHLIAMRFIAAFYPDCIFMATTVTGKAADTEFRATGRVIESPGWKEILKPEKNTADSDGDKGDEGDDTAILPEFTVGESGPHEPALARKQTQPPKLYTEGTLLRAMESAGRTVDDEDLREAMKENGIGRPSTRAAIIETLFKRRYIERRRKSIVATEAGKQLIDIIHEELLKSAKLTGIWESRLRRIERGEYSASDFITELKEQMNGIVLAVLSDNSLRHIAVPEDKPDKGKGKGKAGATAAADGGDGDGPKAPKVSKPRKPPVKSLEQVVCPLCGQGHILKGNTAYGCSRYTSGCTLRLPFDEYPADLTPARLATRLRSKKKK